MRAYVALVIVGVLGIVGCNNAADMDEMKKGQKEILAKLETLEKAVAQVKAAPAPGARPQVDPNKVYNIPTADGPARGPENAKVTVVEFADYQCPFCAQSTGLVDQVLQAYPTDVKFVYKQFPLPPTMHPQALPAAKATVAAGKQGKFWEMHELVFQNSRQLSPEKLKELATQLNLDVPKWEADMAAADTQSKIDQDQSHGRAADVTGTPTFFVNGKRVTNRSLEGFKTLIDEALKKS